MIKKIFSKAKKYFSESEKLLRRAQKMPRYMPVHITTAGLKLHVADLLSVTYQLKEYFFDEEYLLPFSTDTKLKIYDLGANMGIATLYFKKKYPNAEIIAYEADPSIYSYLSENIRQNLNELQQKDIRLHCQAVWIEDGQINFLEKGADTGTVVGATNGKKIPAVNLQRIIEGENEIDFLKMDIEGAEYEVMKGLGETIRKIKCLFIEAHFGPNMEKGIDTMIRILHENGFDYYLKNTNSYDKPFEFVVEGDICYQLSIFAVNKNLRNNIIKKNNNSG